jgi:hypothetical protein
MDPSSPFQTRRSLETRQNAGAESFTECARAPRPVHGRWRQSLSCAAEPSWAIESRGVRLVQGRGYREFQHGARLGVLPVLPLSPMTLGVNAIATKMLMAKRSVARVRQRAVHESNSELSSSVSSMKSGPPCRCGERSGSGRQCEIVSAAVYPLNIPVRQSSRAHPSFVALLGFIVVAVVGCSETTQKAGQNAGASTESCDVCSTVTRILSHADRSRRGVVLRESPEASLWCSLFAAQRPNGYRQVLDWIAGPETKREVVSGRFCTVSFSPVFGASIRFHEDDSQAGRPQSGRPGITYDYSVSSSPGTWELVQLAIQNAVDRDESEYCTTVSHSGYFLNVCVRKSVVYDPPVLEVFVSSIGTAGG